MYFVGVFLCN